MATTLQLSELITAVRQRADMVNTQFVTDAEVTFSINQSAFELYDLLVQSFGEDYFVASPQSISTDGVNETFALNADVYKVLGVDLLVSGNQYVTLKPFNLADRNRFSGVGMASVSGRSDLRYRLRGSNLWITPLPASGQTIRVLYIPRLTPLASASDTFDGISGWTEYVIVDAAIKCLQKEESDVSVLAAQKMALIKRIESAASHRDAGSPSTVSDVYRVSVGDYDPWEGR